MGLFKKEKIQSGTIITLAHPDMFLNYLQWLVLVF